MADTRTVTVPADFVDALEFYAEDTGNSFEDLAQLLLEQGLAGYTQARVDGGQRYFTAAD